MGRWEDEGRRKVGEVVGDEKVWEGERLEKCKCEIKKNIKNNYKKMERKKIMTWMLM